MTLAEFRAIAERAIRVEREGAAEKRDGWALTDFHRATYFDAPAGEGEADG